MIIQDRCFNCDKKGPQELNSLHSVVVLICLRCRPKFEACVYDVIKAMPNKGQKAAILDVLQSIVEDGAL